MNIKNLKIKYKLEQINEKCINAFNTLKLFEFNIDNISYFKEHTDKEYLKYLYKDVSINSIKGIFLGQLIDKRVMQCPKYFVLFLNELLKNCKFYPLYITKSDNTNILF